MHIHSRNNVYYIKDPIDYYEWVSAPDTDAYFILNNTTREAFKRDILPLIKSGECTINPITLDAIKNFIQAPTRYVYDYDIASGAQYAVKVVKTEILDNVNSIDKDCIWKDFEKSEYKSFCKVQGKC